MDEKGMRIETTGTKTMEENLKYIWELNKTLPKNKKKSALIIGASGIGKSQITQNIAREKGCNFIDFRLLTMSETDLKGIPFPSEDNKKAIFLHLDIFPDEERDGKEGILLLEELTSANRSLMSTLYQLVLDREIGGYKLPDGWMIVATGNREEDSGEFYVMPAPLADRFLIYELSNSGTEFVDDWVDWAYDNEIAVEIIAFIRKFPKSLHDFDRDLHDEGMIVFPTPRSWESVSDIIKFDRGKNPKALSKQAQNLIISGVGPIYGHQFVSFYNSKNNLPNIADILNGRPYEKIEKNQENELALTIANLIEIVRDEYTGQEVSEQGRLYMINIIKFLNDVAKNLGVEYFILGMHQIIAINKKLINKLIFMDIESEEFNEIIEKYSHLLS